MKILNYPELFRFFEQEGVSIDFDEKVFQDKNPAQVIGLDHALKDRSLNGNFIDSKSDFSACRSIKLHSLITPSLYHTIKGQQVCKKGVIETIPLLETVSTNEKSLFGFVELSKEMVDAGFSLVGGNMINLRDNPLKEILVVNTKKWLARVPNDSHILNLYFVLML
jgi:hypothetical protein